MRFPSNTIAKFLRALRRTAWFVLPLALLIVAFLALFDWNRLRGPIERLAEAKTGRALSINGDIAVRLRWPVSSIRVGGIAFANPSWARQRPMLTADALEFQVDIPQLLAKRIVVPEARLEHAAVSLERDAQGRRNWLLDRDQQNEDAQVRIGRLVLDRARIDYDDPGEETQIRAELSTSDAPGPGGEEPGVVFQARGRYKRIAFTARGNGGPVLALRDESRPYALRIEAVAGDTSLRARGQVTGLSRLSGLDMQISLRGDSLSQLFPLIGIALPDTSPYVTTGRLIRFGRTWQYDRFSGTIGKSDIAGSVQVLTGGERPVFHADLRSRQLAIEDLGPLIGTRPAPVAATASEPRRVLPDAPFRIERWGSVDADVKYSAGSVRRVEGLPIEHMVFHLKLQDSRLILDPLEFGLAGGKLAARIALDARRDPIRARAWIAAKRIRLNRLLPTVALTHAAVGEINGEFDLAGRGDSVAGMLATSTGTAGMVVSGGEISNLLMEIVGLDVFDTLKFKLVGDRMVKIRCGAAGFRVQDGVMRSQVLALDTDDTNLGAAGRIDLGREQLDLTLYPLPKHTSPLVLRSPIHVRGSFAQPRVELDKGRIAARGLGALALGAVNPLLALVPLIETGPGRDSDCGRLVHDVQALRPAEPAPIEPAERPGRYRPDGRPSSRDRASGSLG